MPPDVTLPASLALLLGALRPCFTAPSFRTFTALVAGLAGQPRRRTVVGMLLGAGLGLAWPHDRAHYFFARARWDLDQAGLAVARLAAALLVPPGAPLRVAVDDSVFRRSGRKVHGAGWQYDGSSPAESKISYGNCFVTAALIVALPFCTREVALPVLARLHLPGKKNRRRGGGADQGKVAVAAELTALLALAFPARAVHAVADAAYHGPALRDLPPNVTWTCRVPRNAVLYAPAPPRSGRPGRPRARGARLGTPAEIAAAARWRQRPAAVYGGRTEPRLAADLPCLWYGSWRTRPVRLVLARAPRSRKPCDLALVTTDMNTPAEALISRYAARWSIEQAFSAARNVLGAGEARNRTRRAVERTVPFAMLASALIITWYARHGRGRAAARDRRASQPWYTAKEEPAFEDMLNELRRVLITARISAGSQAEPTPQQIHDVLTAWHAAAA